MARSNSTKLTKYVSATTIVTAEVANSWFGGLYGSTEGAACAEDDPLVAGHVHDGAHQDGHAQKINLVSHVTDQLRNSNLADNAVVKRNVQSFIDQGSAIPESEMVDGNTYYYLDLSGIRSEIANNGAFLTSGGITSNSPGDLSVDDFVFGSDSLDDDADPNHDNRIIFDKSKAAFRAGRVTGTQWDDASRGFHSTAFGRDNSAIASRSTIAGGDGNTISSEAVQAFIGAGNSNTVQSYNSFVGAGNINLISTASNKSFIGAGQDNTISNGSEESTIVNGNNCTIQSSSGGSFIGSGKNSIINAGCTSATIGGGTTNIIGDGIDFTSYAFIGGGGFNTIIGQFGVIGGGNTNTISGQYSFIGGGNTNSIQDVSEHSVIVGGQNNSIQDGGSHNFIGGGGSLGGNLIAATGGGIPGDDNAIVAGYSNAIDGNAATQNFIGSGVSNSIAASVGQSGIVSGVSNSVGGAANQAFIGGGRENAVTSGSGSVICGGGSVGGGNEINSGLGTSASIFIGAGVSNLVDGSDPRYSAIIAGEGNNINDCQHATIVNGRENIIEVDADYAVAGGYGAAARSFGEWSHSSKNILSGVKGSSQKSIVVFSRNIPDASADLELYLDGTVRNAHIRDNSVLYITASLCMSNTAGTLHYGRKRTFLISANGVGTVTVDASTAHFEELDPNADGAWTIDINPVAANEWRISLNHAPPSGTRIVTCVCDIVQVIHAV